jgi:hypothetical protein
MIEANCKRDERSKAVLSTDIEALNKYKRERDTARKMEALCVEVKEIKDTIKHLLSIIEKNQ